MHTKGGRSPVAAEPTVPAPQIGSERRTAASAHVSAGPGLLPAGREAPYFTAEEVTLLPQHHVADAVYDEATSLLGEAYLAQVLLATVAMNAWNRLGIARRQVSAWLTLLFAPLFFY